jgi:4-diphosphocytidyl-2-C-methyl-D-erythritol kinase
VSRTKAYAKLNLALVVGPIRADGKHEVATVLQAIDLHDDVELEPADALAVEGFAEDTIVRAALEALGEAAAVPPAWRVRIAKRIPVAAGLGGGSSDAAAALRLANASLSDPLEPDALHALAARLGADVPFFLGRGPRLAIGDGSTPSPLDLPSDYAVLVVLPSGAAKDSTAAVYRAFDARDGAEGFEGRRARLLELLAGVGRAEELALLPPNDLASSPLAEEIVRLGAFRADVTGAGPAVFGLFEQESDARRAASAFARAGLTWVGRPLAGDDERGR